MKYGKLLVGLAALATLIAVCLSAGVGVAAPAEKQSNVKEKPKEVTENAKIDYNDETPANPEKVESVAGGKIKITSMTFIPPNPNTWSFKVFKNGYNYVEIVVGANQDSEIIEQGPKAIKISGTAAADTADNWPVRAEGNLEPPKGGSGSAEFHWSAKVGKEKVEVIFDPNPVKTGYALKGDGTPDPKKIKQTVTATFYPKSLAAGAKIVVDDPNGRIEPIAEGDFTCNAGAGTITFAVYGKTATPVGQPNGDAALKATKDGTALTGEAKVIVVIPMYQVHDVPLTTINNWSTPVAGGRFWLGTTYEAVIDIRVCDQHKHPLGSLYDGDGVVDEQFVAFVPPADSWLFGAHERQTIIAPDNHFRGGVKADRNRRRMRLGDLGFPEELKNLWIDYDLQVEGFNHAWGVMVQRDAKCTATMKVWVWGHLLQGSWSRTIEGLRRDYAKDGVSPYTFSDKAP